MADAAAAPTLAHDKREECGDSGHDDADYKEHACYGARIGKETVMMRKNIMYQRQSDVMLFRKNDVSPMPSRVLVVPNAPDTSGVRNNVRNSYQLAV